MIEPTETEPKERLDAFVEVMKTIAREAAESPELLKDAPHERPVRRLDEVKAAKEPIVRHAFPADCETAGSPSSSTRRERATSTERRC